MLVCKQCNFENEPERVYCHNCGAKLDRSLLPPEASKREDPVIVQERVRKMVKPRNVNLKVQVKNFVYCVLLSIVLAGIVLILKPPLFRPEISQEAAADALMVVDDLDADLQLPTPRRRIYTQDQLNTFLAGNLKAAKVEKGSSVPVATFERVFVQLEEKVAYLTIQDSLFGYPLYATTARTLEKRNGVLVSQSLGGSLGRLRIPALAMPALEALFQPVKKAADKPIRMFSQMQSIALHKGNAEFVTPGHP